MPAAISTVFSFCLFFQILSWQAGLAEEFRSDPSAMPCSTNIIPNLTCAFRELTGHDRAAWLVALVTSARCGVSDADMDDLCAVHVGRAPGSRCWPALLHLLSPFFQVTLPQRLTMTNYQLFH